MVTSRPQAALGPRFPVFVEHNQQIRPPSRLEGGFGRINPGIRDTEASARASGVAVGIDDDVIRTPSRRIRIPRVIQLAYYDRVPHREVRFTRRNIFFRDRNRCQYCGKVFAQRDLNLDHVVPLSRGGRSEWTNVVTACVPCNSRKGSRSPEEAALKLFRRPKKPAGHPILRSGWIQSFHEEWRTFLDEAYWNVELSDEVVPPKP